MRWFRAWLPLAMVLSLAAFGCDSDRPAAGDGATGTDGGVLLDGAGSDGAVKSDTRAWPDSFKPTGDGALPKDSTAPDYLNEDSINPDFGDRDSAVPDLPQIDAGAGCGNGVRESGEECDDNNNDNLDGCNSVCQFEQSQRINYLKLQFGLDGFCKHNALGSAVGGTVQGLLQNSLDNGIADGSISLAMHFLGLDDLDGVSDPSLVIGLLGGTPGSGAGYDGTADLDWWYDTTAQAIDAARRPLVKMGATIVNGVLTAGPGVMSFPFDFAGTPVALSLSDVRVASTVGTPSTPTSSAGGSPGHLAAEHLDPSLSSFEGLGGQNPAAAGKLCGNVSANSLAVVPVPSALNGVIGCQEGYDGQNSLLDVFVGGCTVPFLGQAIAPTQPDVDNPKLADGGSGAPYTLTVDSNKAVNGCKDKDGNAVTLSVCLADAAYSSWFKFAAGRVIMK